MDKNTWIGDKIKKLMAEGKPHDQSIAIAISMWNRGDHKQEGGNLPMAQLGITVANGQDLYGNMVQNAQSQQPTGYTGIPSTNMPPFDQTGYNTNKGYDPNMGYTGYVQGDMNLSGKVDANDATDKYGQPTTDENGDAQNQDWIKYNILNPYNGGMDMNTRLAYTGQQFGQGHTGRGIMGAGLSLLGGARSVLSGYGAGKGEQDLLKQYRDKQFNNDASLYRRTDNYQQGGITPPEEQFNIQAQTQSPDWLTSGAAQPIVPGQQALDPTIVPVPTPAQAATPTNVDEGKGFDKNSARDTWAQKTGLPWSEAKRLGYTSGTASDNIKLLGELNDPRFKKENLRSMPFVSPTQQKQQATTGQGIILPELTVQNNAAQRQWNKSLKSNSIDDATYNPLERLVRMEGNNMRTPLPNKSYKSDADQLKMAKMVYDIQHGGAGAFNPSYFQQGGGIHIDESHKGEFTAKANAAGMGVQEYAHHIMANKEHYDPSTVKQANFAINATKFNHQEGGITNSQMMTGNYVAESSNPNVEIEGNEYIKNSKTGQVQKAEGDSHENGGMKVNLPNGSKVLSQYTKIGANNAKIFGEMFDIKSKAGDTFANVLDKYNTKIGVKKLEEEEKELMDKLEKNTKTSMDKSTKQINEDFLAQEIADVNKKKDALNKLKAQAFETIFNEQEKIPKKGDGTQILDKSGNPIKQMGGYTKDKNYYQEGGQPQDSNYELLRNKSILRHESNPDGTYTIYYE